MWHKRLSGCGSGTEYLAVTPWGDFYPCHQFVGQEEFLMGNVDDGIRPAGHLWTSSSACNVYAKEKCRNCFAKVLLQRRLRGKFLQFPWYDSATPMIIGCELQRKRVECAIMIKAALADKEAEADLHIRPCGSAARLR